MRRRRPRASSRTFALRFTPRRERRHSGARGRISTLCCRHCVRLDRFTAVELEALGERQAILRSAHADARRSRSRRTGLAWLACLRAPWCDSCSRICSRCERADATGFIDAIGSDSVRIALSADGPQACAPIRQPGDDSCPAVARPGRRSRCVSARHAALGGPACVDDPQDLAASERYFELLATYDYAGDIADYDGSSRRCGR